MTLTLGPPKPVTTLKLSPVLTSQMRLVLVSDFMVNLGATPTETAMADMGFRTGLMCSVEAQGLDASGYVRDRATLRFDDLVNDPTLMLDISGTRSLTEVVSRKLAKGLEYSVHLMRRKGLRVVFVFSPRPPATLEQMLAACGGQPCNNTPPPGHAMRQVFSIRPGLDTGTQYTHSTAWRMG